MSTKDNLAAAFAGESQANRKYLMFAEQAEKDGYKGAAKLFRAAAEAETIHAFAEFRTNGGVGTTAENLQAAINGETYEFTEMYPPMIKEAEAEGDKTAEKVHAQLYKEALADIEGDADYYLCPFCGYIHKGAPTGNCPICGAKAELFKKF